MLHPEGVVKIQSHTEVVLSDSCMLRWTGTQSGIMQNQPNTSVKLCAKLCLGVTGQITHLRLNFEHYAMLGCRYTHGWTQQSGCLSSASEQFWENNQQPSVFLTWIRRSLNINFVHLLIFCLWLKHVKAALKVSKIWIFCFCELSVSEIIAIAC